MQMLCFIHIRSYLAQRNGIGGNANLFLRCKQVKPSEVKSIGSHADKHEIEVQDKDKALEATDQDSKTILT